MSKIKYFLYSLVPIFILLLTCVLLFISVNNIDVIIIITLLQILLYVRIYTLRWYHIMILLMILELMILNIFLVSIIVSWSLSGSYFLIYCFVTLRVAEARVGISLLTILIRAHGRDYLTLD